MIYDYETGKKRIEDILDNDLEVIEQEKLPKDENFTFDNAYYSWVSAIFVDIRNSTDLFNNEDKEDVSKIIRAFTSEVIEILRNDEYIREIGIRGDCVYAIYTSPKKIDTYNTFRKAVFVNDLIDMLNNLYVSKGYSEIRVGIAMSTAQELVVKAGRKGVDINNKVWIGSAVSKASKFSSMANKNGFNRMIISDCTYINIIDKYKELYGDKAADWFKKHNDSDLGYFYDCSIINKAFDKWIKENTWF